MLDALTESRLRSLMDNIKIKCKCIVLSTCHSSIIASILREKGAPIVVSIKSIY